VHHDLLAFEVGVAEGRRDVHYAGHLKGLRHFERVEHPLEVGEAAHEEAGVARRDHERPVLALAQGEGEGGQFLLFQPVEGLGAHLVEFAAEPLGEAHLVGGLGVAHHRAVGVAAAHVRLGVVDGKPVFALDDAGLHDLPLARNVVANVVGLVAGPAHGKLEELGAVYGEEQPAAVGQDVPNLRGDVQTLPILR